MLFWTSISKIFEGLSPAGKGAIYMIASCLAFASLWATIRITSEHVSFPIMVFYRNLIGTLALTPMIFRNNFAVLRTHRFKAHSLRATSGFIAIYTTFFAVATAPLADVVAISYGAPLFATLAAVFMLGEKIRTRRISAILIGFIGMLIVLRPGGTSLTIGHWSALGAALASATSMIAIKQLTRTEHPRTVVAYSFIMILPLSFLIALPYWIWPNGQQLGLLIAIGLISIIGQSCLTRAFSHADATSVLPFDFVRLVLATGFGVIIFGERFDIRTILGASIILIASVYLAHREAIMQRTSPSDPR